jgi:hypothetical protein
VATDTYERQRAVRERIERVKNFARAVDEAAVAALDAAGVKIEDLDPMGALRAALPAVAGVARSTPDFDVVMAGVGAHIGLRVRHVDGEVDLAVMPVVAHEPADPPIRGGTVQAVEGLTDIPPEAVAADLARVLRGADT